MRVQSIESNGIVRGTNGELLGRVQPANPREYVGVWRSAIATFSLQVGRRLYFVHNTAPTPRGRGRSAFWVQSQGDEPPRRFFTLYGAVAHAVFKIRNHEDHRFFHINKARRQKTNKRLRGGAARR